MKMFKKLAAVALAAVLALSMVGCGAGGTGSSFILKNEVLNLIEDGYHMEGLTATHTAAMDTEAAKLIENAAKIGAEEGNTDTVKALLEKQSDEGDYIAIFMRDTQLRTELMQQSCISRMYGALNTALSSNPDPDAKAQYANMTAEIGSPAISADDNIEMGAATGTIKGESYLVLLVKKAAV